MYIDVNKRSVVSIENSSIELDDDDTNLHFHLYSTNDQSIAYMSIALVEWNALVAEAAEVIENARKESQTPA